MSFAIYRRGGRIMAVGFSANEAMRNLKKVMEDGKVPQVDDRHAIRQSDSLDEKDFRLTMRLCQESLADAFRKNEHVPYDPYTSNVLTLLTIDGNVVMNNFDRMRLELLAKKTLTYKGGHWSVSSCDNPEGLLVMGTEYKILDVEVHSFHTRVMLVNFPDKWFNSTLFKEEGE